MLIWALGWILLTSLVSLMLGFVAGAYVLSRAFSKELESGSFDYGDKVYKVVTVETK